MIGQKGWGRLYQQVVCLLVALIALVHMHAQAATDQAPFAGEHRLALVIGNSSYQEAPLRNPGNDARLMQKTLISLGFEVIARTDLDSEGMRQAVEKFSQKLADQPNSVGVFYYAGHGVQVKGVNYLIPVGRSFSTEPEVEAGALSLDSVLTGLSKGKTKLSIVVLDACRSNPFAKAVTRSLALSVAGLAKAEAPSGSLIAYATAPGSVANDGRGSNGLYTQYLTQNMLVPGITVEQVFKRTRERVESESDAAQSPREESSLKGSDFYLVSLSDAKKMGPEVVEQTLWEAIRSSTDPEDFDNYLHDYPTGRFSSLARQSAARLHKATQDRPELGPLNAGYSALSHGDVKTATKIFQQLADSQQPLARARGQAGLAEVALTSGAPDQAVTLADSALQVRPKSTAALMVKSRISYESGDQATAQSLASRAVDGEADLPAQRVGALLAVGNLRRVEQPVAARQAYQEALRLDPQNLLAITNLATVMRSGGDPEQALKLIQEHQQAVAGDRVLEALAFEIQRDIAQRRDAERQKQIDASVQDLVARFREQNAKPAAPVLDSWTTAPVAVSVLGFQDQGVSMSGRAGMEVLLGQELARELAAQQVVVVDRALIDKVLSELKLGASVLADPETQLRLGRLTSARLIATGRMFRLSGKAYVSFRIIDTETSQIVLNRTEEFGPEVDPIIASERLAKLAAQTVMARYALKGRIVSQETDGVVINLGRRHGLQPGDTFNVLDEGTPVKFNGKVIGTRDTTVASLRITAVDESVALAVPLAATPVLKSNLRIVQTHSGSTP